MEWKTHTIGEICDIGGGEVKTGPFGSQLHQSDYNSCGIPVVMPKDIIDGTISVSSIARVSDEHVSRLARHQLSQGDIVYGRRGDIGRQALIREHNEGWLCGTGCLRLSIGSNAPLTCTFLHLYLRQPEVIKWISNQAVGATMPNLNTAILRSIPITFPICTLYQEKITSLITSYDTLIENNNRRIAILEEMAQTLYREWFVNFRYPEHADNLDASSPNALNENQGKPKLIDSPLGQIPEGWEVKVFSESFDFWNGKKCTKSELGEFDLYGANGIVGKAEAWKYENAVIIGRVGAYCGAVEYCFNRFWGSDNTIIAKCKTDTNISYLFLLLEHFNLNKYAGGSAQPLLTQTTLKQLKYIAPPEGLINEFEKISHKFYEGVVNLKKRNQNLKKQRDMLLPKLISGQIALKD